MGKCVALIYIIIFQDWREIMAYFISRARWFHFIGFPSTIAYWKWSVAGEGMAWEKAFRRNCQYIEMAWCSKKIMCQTFSFIQRVGKHGVSILFSNRKKNTWHKTVSFLPSDEMTVPRQTRERLMLPPSFSLSPSAPVRLARSLYDRIVTEIHFNCFIKNKEYKTSKCGSAVKDKCNLGIYTTQERNFFHSKKNKRFGSGLSNYTSWTH